MNKLEFVHSLAEEHDILKGDAKRITSLVFDHVRKLLLAGQEVRIDGVGAFTFKYRAAGTVNNNLLGKRHSVDARVKLKFRPSPSMNRALNAILAPEMSDDD